MAKILVVDDDSAVRAFAKLLLSRNNHTVETAGSLQQAVQMLERANQIGQPFNVVLSDAYHTMSQGPAQTMGLDLAEWMKNNNYPAKMVLQSGFMESHFTSDTRYQDLQNFGVITHFVGKSYASNAQMVQAVEDAAALAVASGAVILPPPPSPPPLP